MEGSPLVAGVPRSSWDLPRRVAHVHDYIESVIYAEWLSVDRDYEKIRIDMQTLFRDLGIRAAG